MSSTMESEDAYDCEVSGSSENEENAIANVAVVDVNPEIRTNLLYQEGHWSPFNKNGIKVYGRDLLLALRKDPKSNIKPQNLLSNVMVDESKEAMNSVPVTPRREERGGGGSGVNASADKKHSRNVSNDDGWSTAPSCSSRTPFTVQSDKLKNKAPMMDEPLGSIQMFGNWGRGFNIKTQPPLTTTAKMYAALENISTETYKRPVLGQLSTSAAAVLASAELTPDQLVERRIKNIVEEYVNDCCSVQECNQDIKTSISPSAMSQLVSYGYINILERSRTARLRTGYLFAQLLKLGTLSLQDYCVGLEAVLEEADELIIDIPKVWDYVAELISPFVCADSETLENFQNVFELLINKEYSLLLLFSLLKLIMEEKRNASCCSDYLIIEARNQSMVVFEDSESLSGNILEEYLNGNWDLQQCKQYVRDCMSSSSFSQLVSDGYMNVLEKTKKERLQTGFFFAQLIKLGTLPLKSYCVGLSSVLEEANQLIFDVPSVWGHVAEEIYSNYISQRPPTPQRTADGFHVATQQTFVPQQPPNQAKNRVPPLRGMPRTGPPTQASTPPNSNLKVQQMSQQPSMNIGQQPMYQTQPTQFVPMALQPQMYHLNTSTPVQYFNGAPRPQGYVGPAYQMIPSQTITYQYPQAPSQPQATYFYNASQLLQRPPPPVASAPQNPTQPPAPAMALNQPAQQHGSHAKIKRRSRAIPIIDPTTGKDKLSEMYEQEQDDSHPPSGESSARQTPQPPLRNPNKEVQAAFAKKKVAQAIGKDDIVQSSKLQAMNSVPVTPRREERGGGGSGFNASADKKRSRNVSNDDGWSTAPSCSSRTPFTVQSDKLKNKAPIMHEPLASIPMFENLGRGFNIKSQPPLTTTAKMYAALENISTETYKRPVLGGLRMKSKDHYSSTTSSLEPNYRQSFEGQLSTSAAAVLAPAELTPDQLVERRIKNIVEEYVHDCCSVQECNQDIKTSISPSAMSQLVSYGYINILERSRTARLRTGYLFAQLIKLGTLSLQDYCVGLEAVLEEADELIIDIPKVWDYVAELISPVVCEDSETLENFQNVFELLINKEYSLLLLFSLLKLIMEEKRNASCCSDYLIIEAHNQTMVVFEDSESLSRNILEEYLNGNWDLQQCKQYVRDCVSSSSFSQLVSDGYMNVLEKSKKERLQTGFFFAQLIKLGTLPLKSYCVGLSSVLEEANQLIFDVPSVWGHVAEEIFPVLCETKKTPMDSHQLFDLLTENHSINLLSCLCKMFIQTKT